MTPVGDLSGFIHRRMDELGIVRRGKSGGGRELARRSGGRLSQGMAYRYIAGDSHEPGEDVLAGLATALSGTDRTVTIEELRVTAGLPAGGGPYTPPTEASRMDERSRKAVDEMIRLLARPTSENEGPSADYQGSGTLSQTEPPQPAEQQPHRNEG